LVRHFFFAFALLLLLLCFFAFFLFFCMFALHVGFAFCFVGFGTFAYFGPLS